MVSHNKEAKKDRQNLMIQSYIATYASMNESAFKATKIISIYINIIPMNNKNNMNLLFSQLKINWICKIKIYLLLLHSAISLIKIYNIKWFTKVNGKFFNGNFFWILNVLLFYFHLHYTYPLRRITPRSHILFVEYLHFLF